MIRAPGMDELKVSLSKPCEKSDGVTVWEWTGSVLDEGAEASKWFSDFIGKPCRLVRFNEGSAQFLVSFSRIFFIRYWLAQKVQESLSSFPNK